MTTPEQASTPDVLAPEAKGPWDPLVCALPDCGAPLYMERTTSLGLLAGFTVAETRDDEHTSSWQVSCQEGHVLLTSGDAESAKFGLCSWHDEEEHDCPRRDLDRLRKIARVGPHEHMGKGTCRDCGDLTAPVPAADDISEPR